MTGERAAVKSVPGFARMAAAARRAVLSATTPLFGEPDRPTALQRALDLAETGIMTYGSSAARLGRAAERASLLARGARPSTVLRKTGYQPGVFGPGVETRGDAFFRPSSLFGPGKSGKLGELADVHPGLLRAYPGIDKALTVRVVPDSEWAGAVAAARDRSLSSAGGSSRGFFDRDRMELAVRGPGKGERLDMFFDRADKTLVHELQHAAHEMDGIPPSREHANFEAYRTDAREVDARNSAHRNLLTPEERMEMPRAMTQDVGQREVHMAAKGGEESPHRNFRNFLATDKVPGSIFGYPVVQSEEGYTPEDLEFFRKNPKAAGFYDTGEDEEMEEDVPRQAVKAKPSRGAYPGSLNNPGNVEKRKERRRGEVDSPHERWAKFATPQDGLREMADAIRQIAAVKLPGLHQDFTIRNFAELYAPRKNRKGLPENNTDKYIADISKYSGFGPDDELPRWNEDDMAKFLRTVVRFESGYPHSQWFTDEEYDAAARQLQEGAFD